MQIFNAFWVGGVICVVAQLLIDYTKLTPARIMVSYVIVGVIISALGLYQPLIDYAGAGATVPIMGFGHTLAKGVEKAVNEQGIYGVFIGGVTGAAGGITAAVVFGYIAALFSKPKIKK